MHLLLTLFALTALPHGTLMFKIVKTFTSTNTSNCFFMFSSTANKDNPCQNLLVDVKDLRTCIENKAGSTVHLIEGVEATDKLNCIPNPISKIEKDWFIEGMYDIKCGLVCDLTEDDRKGVLTKKLGDDGGVNSTASFTTVGLLEHTDAAGHNTSSTISSIGKTTPPKRETEEVVTMHNISGYPDEIENDEQGYDATQPHDGDPERQKRSTREGVPRPQTATINDYKALMQLLTSINIYANITSTEGGVCERARVWTSKIEDLIENPVQKPNNLGIRKQFSRGRDIKDKTDIFTDYQCGVAIWGSTITSEGHSVFWALTPSVYAKSQAISCSPSENCHKIDVMYSCRSKCDCVVHTLVWGSARLPFVVDISKGNCRRQITYTDKFAEKICPLGVTMYKSKLLYPGSYSYTPTGKLCFDGNFSTTIEDGNFSDCLSLNEDFNFAKCPKLASTEKTCKAALTEVRWDTIIITVNVNNKQLISYPYNGMITTSECEKSCTIEATRELEVIVTCSNGISTIVKAPVRVQTDCGWWISHLSTTLSEPICRMGEHRIWLLLTLIFLFFGWAASIIGLITLSYFIGCCRVCYRKARVSLHKDGRVCEDCGECVYFKELAVNHEFCDHGLCPYCSATIGANLKEHARHCPSKNAVIGGLKDKIGREVNASRRGVLRLQNCLWNPWSWGIVWLASFIILLTMAAVSVSAEEDDYNFDRAHSRFSLIRQTVQTCQLAAGFKEGQCQAKEPEVSSRFKRYSDSDTIKKELMESSISVLPGDLSRSVYESNRILSLTVTGRINTQDGELLEGNVLMDFPINPNVGSIIEIGDGSTYEKRRVTLSILETQQIYSYRFLYYTSDRQIATVDEWSCTGSCSDVCRCTLDGCKTLRIDDALNAGCDTVDCWKLSTGGCVCCKMYLESVVGTSIWSVWETEYQNTEVIMCLGTSSELSKCFISEEGKTVTVDDFEIQLTKVYGVDRKLPSKIALVHNRRGSGNIQVNVPDQVLLEPNICYENNCRHGEIGDIQFDRLGYSMNPNKFSNRGRWDSSGVTVEKVCGVLWKDVSCKYNNLISNITEQFAKVERTSKHLNDTFHIHESEATIGMLQPPRLRLDVRPLQGGGILQLKLTTNGHELRRLNEQIVMSVFTIEGCSGCVGCMTSGACTIKHSLKTPDRVYIHVKSCTDGLVVQADSILSQVDVAVHNVTYFTQMNYSEICLKIEETGDVQRTNKISQWSAESKILLKRGIVVEGSVKKSSNRAGSTGFWSSIGGFFSSIGSVFTSWWGVLKAVFSNWRTFLIIIIVILAVVFLKFIGLFSILGAIFSVCRRRTAVSFGKKKAELKASRKSLKAAARDSLDHYKGKIIHTINRYGEKKHT